jgi:cell division protein FtsB
MFAQLRTFLPTTILALLIFYFGYQALTGDRGLLTQPERTATLQEKSVELAKLETERKDLELRARLLRDSSLSADLLEERSRRQLGLVDPRDYVIRTRP